MNKLAFVFPGQGSQTLGMCAELAQNHALVEQTFTIASTELDYDLWQLVQEGPEEKLNRTEVTQPALLTVGYAMWQVWCNRQGRMPDIVAGHSLGEYTALVCAGVLDFATTVKLVQQRGRLMQQAVPTGEGGMAAIIGLEDEGITKLCEQAAEGEALSAANFNSPGQVVIAGTAAAIERACALAKSSGAKMAKRLDVSVPSHCALMQPAAEVFANDLEKLTFNPPEIPVIQNTDAEPHSEPDTIRETVLKQLYSPVRWQQSILKMVDLGVTDIVECGPGKVLSGLNKRINRDINSHGIQDNTTLDKTLQELA